MNKIQLLVWLHPYCNLYYNYFLLWSPLFISLPRKRFERIREVVSLKRGGEQGCHKAADLSGKVASNLSRKSSYICYVWLIFQLREARWFDLRNRKQPCSEYYYEVIRWIILRASSLCQRQQENKAISFISSYLKYRKRSPRHKTKPLLYSQLSSILSFSTVDNVKKSQKFQLQITAPWKKFYQKGIKGYKS